MLIHFQNKLFSNSTTTINKTQETLTKCSKMTEEGKTIRNGINGAASVHNFNYGVRNQQVDGVPPKSSSEIDDVLVAGASPTTTTTNNKKSANTPGLFGGRLQFFKDGKFILELAKGGSGWVSVPRKTYWPPTAPPPSASNTITVNHQTKNESSTSLSFSDDNSSVQSSPWQRDHCWKQTTPRRNVSTEMSMYYCRPTGYALSQKSYKTAKKKRRRPYDAFTIDNIINLKNVTKQITKTDKNDILDVAIKIENNGNEHSSSPRPSDDSNSVNNSSDAAAVPVPKTESIFHKVQHKQKGKQPLLRRQKLSVILQKLIDKIPGGIALLSGGSAGVGSSTGVSNHLSSNSIRHDLHYHQQHVSPRKRILRELEKVSLDDFDLSLKKRSRAKGTNNNTSSGASGGIAGQIVTSTYAQFGNSSSNSNTTSNNNNNNAGNASHHINFPTPSSIAPVSSSGKLVNGNHESMNVTSSVTTPVPQTPSRPISCYSINSLLGHNSNLTNNNNSIKNESNTTINSGGSRETDQTHSHTMLSSPKSPNHYPQHNNKSATINSNSHLSPSITSSNPYAKIPTSNSPMSYGQSRSPDLSPSPEQSYTRFRQPPYTYNSTAVSSPSSGFHPYLSSASSSRGSPSAGALSPPSSLDSHRYISNVMSGSPGHQQYSKTSCGSPLSYSPSGFSSQISPQHYSAAKSASYNMNNLMQHSNTNKSRDSSPNSMLSTKGVESMAGSGNRTVPKKTAAHRQQQQQYESTISPTPLPPAPHPSNLDYRSINESYYKSIAIHEQQQTTSSKPIDEKDYRLMNNISNNSSTVLAGLDIKSSNAVNLNRPPPSLPYPQNMFYMYTPQQLAAAAADVSPSSVGAGFLPPPLYHSMTLANVYRNSMFMQYPPAAAAAAAAAAASAVQQQPSRLTSRMLSAYGPPGMSSLYNSSSPSSTSPWRSIQPHHRLLTDEAIPLIRIKDEPSSDVPLNLSKH